jgi:hypothetical protein
MSVWPSFEIAESGGKKPSVSSKVDVDFFSGVRRTKAGKLRQVRVFGKITKLCILKGTKGMLSGTWGPRPNAG